MRRVAVGERDPEPMRRVAVGERGSEPMRRVAVGERGPEPMWRVTVGERNPELRELQSFIVGSKRACSWLQRETLSFSSEIIQVFFKDCLLYKHP